MGAVTLGVDVGQRVDPTAISVAEGDARMVDGKDRPEGHHVIRHLERLALGTPYPQIVARIAAVAAGVVERTGERPRLYLDATGVGTPVLDLLRDAGVQAQLVAVYFTHGDRRTVDEHGDVRLGKAWLVSRLQALLQTGRLHLPDTKEARQTGKELLDYEIRVDQDANDKYGAFKVGSHDDLVTALGLATQIEPVIPASATADVPASAYRSDRRSLLTPAGGRYGISRVFH
jgi:hypothetical protein